MFKKIPGNNKFQIDLFGNIKTINNIKECTPVIYNNQVKIDLYGKTHIVDITWLALLAHFEVDLPLGMEDRIFDINFTDTDLARKSVTNKMMLIKKPIIINKKYRVVPCFTRYAISNIGELIEIKSNKIIKLSKHTFNDYPCVKIYDPEKGYKQNFVIHRLVAMAWNYNRDYFIRPIVNHKDGNKKNFYYNNLEWCSYYENSLHAVNTGLRNDNIPCRIFDIIDKSVKEFQSVKQACEFMGIRNDIKLHTLLTKTKHKLLNDRYQIKLNTDTSDWFYEKHDIGTVAGRYSIIIEKQDGTKEEHPDVRTFKRKFKVWNISNIDKLIEKAKFLYPELKFSYMDNYVSTSIQAYDITTNKIIETNGIRQMSRLINRDYSGIRIALLAGETRIFDGFAFRYKTDIPWNTKFTEYKCRSKCILATNLETCEVLNFDSERKVAVHFNVDRSVIRRLLKNQKLIHGFKLEYETV